jgi:NitT/TauT family transport system substrate-binding protein
MSHERSRRAVLLAGLCAGIAGATMPGVRAQTLDTVRIGNNGVVSDAVFYIAEKHGFFAKQRIKPEFVLFDSGPRMIAPLGAGQIDVGAGASSAGLFNAVARGIDIKVVADKGSMPPGYLYVPLLVRKDLVDSGKFKTIADLRGMKVAEGGEGGTPGSYLTEALKPFGMTYKDVQHVYMSYPQQVAALANKAVDAALTAEPSATQAVTMGSAVRVSNDKIYPNQQVAVLLYNGDFAKKHHDVAQRFMNAYVEAVRYFNQALKDGKFAGPAADDVIKIMIENTRVKDAKLYREMVPNGVDVNGRLNIESMKKDLAFYRSQGYIEKPIEVEAVVDESFVKEAVKTLGLKKTNN